MNADDRAHWLEPSPPLPVDDDEPAVHPPERSELERQASAPARDGSTAIAGRQYGNPADVRRAVRP